MRKLATLLFTLNFLVTLGQGISPDHQKVISRFIECVKNQKIEELSDLTSYPLLREYPLADIKNKREFINRYKEVFDTRLIKMIVNSDLSQDWAEVGWRGMMLLNGELWLDVDGRLLSVNYQSSLEAKKKEELIKAEKRTLHVSIKAFKQPLMILETARFRIRIDEMANGDYRYASWSIKGKMSEKPDLVIGKGVLIPDGSGGNYFYQFDKGEYRYECSIIEMGEDDSPPAMLTVYKGEEEILSQNAQIIRK